MIQLPWIAVSLELTGVCVLRYLSTTFERTEILEARDWLQSLVFLMTNQTMVSSLSEKPDSESPVESLVLISHHQSRNYCIIFMRITFISRELFCTPWKSQCDSVITVHKQLPDVNLLACPISWHVHRRKNRIVEIEVTEKYVTINIPELYKKCRGLKNVRLV